MRKTRSLHPDCEMIEDRLVMSAVPGHATVAGFAMIDLAKPKPKPKPAAPSFTANAISTTQVNLSWTKVSGASKYLIEESVNGRWIQLATANKNATGYTVNGLTPNTNYTFDVVYVKSGKHQETPKAATTLPLPPPTPPSAPVFTAKAISPLEVQLAWNSVPGATSYLISVDNPPEYESAGWEVIGTFTPGTTASGVPLLDTVSGLYPGLTFGFNVSAQNSAGTTAGTPVFITMPES